MTSIAQLTAVMRVDECSNRAAWSYAQAAACRWRQPLRRALLIRRARVLEREMDAWATVLYEELAAARRREGAAG